MQVPMPPKWFNTHGLKMSLQRVELPIVVSSGDVVLIGNEVAKLQIFPTSSQGVYKVFWSINFPDGGHVQGEIQFQETVLRRAFALDNTPFGMEPGHFIREGSFLNIPMSGTGADGDPNISVFLSDEIKEAVRQLIKVSNQ